MKITFQLVILLLLSTNLIAQPDDPGLQLGAKVPDISMGKLLNKPGQKLKISDFRGKLLILDFWGVHCGVCIENMPKIESLQKEFNGKVQFVYVTRDPENQVNELLKKRNINPSIPFIVSDKALEKLFPHTGVPLHVWIEPNGKLYAITEHYSTSSGTINSYLRGEAVQLPRRWDWAYNPKFPILSEQNSALLGYADSYSLWLGGALSNIYVGGGSRVLKDEVTGRVTGLRMFNRNLRYLYGFAYMKDVFQLPINYLSLFKNNRIIMDLKDSSVISLPSEDSEMAAWNARNLYTYELKLPAGSSRSIFDILKQELSIKFPQYQAVIEDRKLKCIVLSDLLVKDQEKAREKDSLLDPGISYSENSFTIQNTQMNSFLEHLIYVYSSYDTPFINESVFKGKLHMQLGARPLSIEAFNQELNKYGFQLKLEEREIKMLVVKDRQKEIAAN